MVGKSCNWALGEGIQAARFSFVPSFAKTGVLLLAIVFVIALISGCSNKTPQIVTESESSGQEAHQDDNQNEALAAFATKVQEIQGTYGYTTAAYNGSDCYLDGLAYARIADFGDGKDRLLVCYHDPSRDTDAETPGGQPESYPVEVWEYNPSTLSLEQVYSGFATLDGQNVYCCALCLQNGGDCTYVTERHNQPGPSGYSYVSFYGASDDGEFGLLTEYGVSWEYDSDKEESIYTDIVDGESVTESEAQAHEEKWADGDAEVIYLTALSSSDRTVDDAMNQTRTTVEALGLSFDGGGGDVVPSESHAGQSADGEVDNGETHIDTAYYRIDVPASWGGVDYETDEDIHPAETGKRDISSGCMTTVYVGEYNFIVVCLEVGWPMQGVMVFRDLGEPSDLPGYVVRVATTDPNYVESETNGASRGLGDRIDEIASFVTVK